MILKSFTEPHRLINFDEPSHVYTDLHTGTKMVSSTTHIKKYKEEFDADDIAAKIEGNWGVSKESIKSMWNNNGLIASGMGTALHEALERYTNYKKLGLTIKDNTSRRENPAMPKHPIIRNVIEGFEEIDRYYDQYDNTLCEVLITAGKYCALVDRLYTNNDDKHIRISDYKFNVGAFKPGVKYRGKFKDLPDTKVSGYQLQMSFHSDIFKRFGYEVDGLTAFVLDDKWHVVDLEPLEGVLELE